MAFIDPTQAMGDVVKLARTNPRHLAGMGELGAAAGAAFPTDVLPQSSVPSLFKSPWTLGFIGMIILAGGAFILL